MQTGAPNRIQELQALYDAADTAAAAHILNSFDNWVATSRNTGEWLPDNVAKIRRQLADDRIILPKALWLCTHPDERGNYQYFQGDLLDKIADALDGNEKTDAGK